MELKELICSGFWAKVEPALLGVEDALQITFDSPASNTPQVASTMPKAKTSIWTCLEIHTLIIGVVFYTHVGDAEKAQTRLKRMHDHLDGGALDALGPYGLVDVCLPSL